MADFKFCKSGTLTISRTGFTGDLGYELWTSPDRALELWDILFKAGALYGIRPIGTNALNMARIEAGFIIANMDFITAEQAVRGDRARSPLEMGLEWMIDFNKGHFNGRRALLEEKTKGTSKWALVGLDIEGNVSAEHSLIYHNKKHEVGHITAALWSPTTKRNIALAMMERPYHAERNGDLWVEIYASRELQYHKLMVKARVTPRPFINLARRKAVPPLNY
jgi:aminomethyltransferase